MQHNSIYTLNFPAAHPDAPDSVTSGIAFYAAPGIIQLVVHTDWQNRHGWCNFLCVHHPITCFPLIEKYSINGKDLLQTLIDKLRYDHVVAYVGLVRGDFNNWWYCGNLMLLFFSL
jgi:hypothetical protein